MRTRFQIPLLLITFTILCSTPIYPRSKAPVKRKSTAHAAIVYNPNRIVISKSNFRLYVISDTGDTLMNVPVGIGSNPGQKTKTGDRRTPHGQFTISSIEKASDWSHDFGDGKGSIPGAYGPWFLRLKMPRFSSIGIHGTHAPQSIGTRCSEGCIRLQNADITQLRQLATIGMRVTIESERIAPDPDICPMRL